MNVVDSSGWLDYLADGPDASFFAPAIERSGEPLVPTLSIVEVFKRVLGQRDESQALQAIALMHQEQVVELTASLSLDAARLSRSARLPMADSIMLATARAHGATFWIQDPDFEGLPDVRFQQARPG